MWLVEVQLRWIETAFVPGIAAADAPDAFGGADYRTVLLHCLDEVIAASGAKAALIAKYGAQEDLVQPNAADQEPSWHTDENCPDKFHVRCPFNLLATRVARRGNDRVISS